MNGAEVFKNYLASIGMKTTDELVPADRLRATQRDMKGLGVAKIMRDANEGKFDPASNPIFVSSDGYVVDRHHRWAAVVGLDARDGKLGESKIPIVRVNAPIAEVLHLANLWSERFGIEQAEGIIEQSANVRAKKP